MRKFLCLPLSRLVVPGIAVVLALFAARVARADFIVTMTQEGTNVDGTGIGAIDLTGLRFISTDTVPALLWPSLGEIGMGPASLVSIDLYIGTFSGSANFGTGGESFANSGSGDVVGGEFPVGAFFVPHGYVSNSPLSDGSTWDNATFSSLGVTPGTYEWTWGTGANQNFILDVVSVPEPSLFLPLALLLLGWLGVSRARRRTEARLRP